MTRVSLSFFCVLRGTQRTLTGCPATGAEVLARVPKVPGIRTTLGQHCTAECRVALRAVISPKAIRHFSVVVEYYECDLAFDWSC